MHDNSKGKYPQRKGVPQPMRLKRSEAFQVMKCIDKHWKQFREMTVQEAVEMISDESKITVTVPVVRSLIRDMGKVSPFRGAATRDRGRQGSRIRFLASQILALHAEIEKMGNAINFEFDPGGRVKVGALRGLIRGGEYYQEYKGAASEVEAEYTEPEDSDENE